MFTEVRVRRSVGKAPTQTKNRFSKKINGQSMSSRTYSAFTFLMRYNDLDAATTLDTYFVACSHCHHTVEKGHSCLDCGKTL